MAKDKINQLVKEIYEDETDIKNTISGIERLIDKYQNSNKNSKSWLSEKDITLITYGDSIIENSQKPLQTIKHFCDKHLADSINTIHILPFYPFSSDDGFSVIDYFQVNPVLGNWEDINALSQHYHLAFDAVVNHISSQSEWFNAFLAGNEQYENYFVCLENNDGLENVFRPRATPLLTEFQTSNGIKKVWTTFSDDQIDLNVRTVEVLLKVIEVMLFYSQHGSSITRLDAIGFLWKELGTTCIHLPKTHKIIQLIRLIIIEAGYQTLILTETNVPHKDNISYFGNGHNEAHMVYQFSLPPLVLYSFVKENATALTNWASTLSLPSENTTFFNFLSSHDGIGVVPLKGLIPEGELNTILKHVENNGGLVSYKTLSNGQKTPYELNITYFDAIYSPKYNLDTNINRFICAHAILLAMQGLPAIYIHSLLGSRNAYDYFNETKHNRSINREKLIFSNLEAEIDNPEHLRYKVLTNLKNLIHTRKNEPCFHPNAQQQILNVTPEVFAIERSNGYSKLICLHNISDEQIEISKAEIGIENTQATDIISKQRLNEIQINPFSVLWIKVT